MRALLAIAEREIKERWLLLAGALLVGALPWVLRSLAPRPLGETVVGFGWLLAILYGVAVALVAGWTLIGPELSNGRLAFFFSHPAPWWAIWGGKWLAAVLLTETSALVTWLLVAPLSPETRPSLLGGLADGSIAFAGTWLLLAVAMSHLTSIAYRSRSPLLVLDLTLLSALLVGLLWARPVTLLGSLPGTGRTMWSLVLSLGVLTAVPTVAGAIQVRRGRIDSRRGHAAVSLTFWTGVVVLLMALGIWSHRVRHFSVGEIATLFRVSVQSDGEWIDVSGARRSRPLLFGSFLFNRSSGAWIQRPLDSTFELAFSRDGRRAVWLGTGLLGEHLSRLVVAELDGRSPQIRSAPLGVSIEWIDDLCLSLDSSRVAVISARSLDVFEVPSGRHIAAFSAHEGRWRPPLAFRDDSRLLAYRTNETEGHFGQGSRELVEVDVESRQIVALGSVQVPHGRKIAQIGVDGRVLTRPEGREAGPVELHDVRKGLLLSIPLAGEELLDAARLADDGIAILHASADLTTRLDSFAPDGSRTSSTVLPAANFGVIGSQPSPTQLLVATRSGIGPTTHVLELRTGLVAGSFAAMDVGRALLRRHAVPAGSFASRLLQKDDGALFVLEPSGPRRILPPRH